MLNFSRSFYKCIFNKALIIIGALYNDEDRTETFFFASLYYNSD